MKIPKKYIEGKQIKRTKIINPIKRCEISRYELQRLIDCIDYDVKHNNIDNPFIEKETLEKRPKNQWNEDYLEKLVYKGVDGCCFTKEFLLHLYDVAKTVQVHKRISMIKYPLIGITAVIAIIGGVVASQYFIDKEKKNDKICDVTSDLLFDMSSDEIRQIYNDATKDEIKNKNEKITATQTKKNTNDVILDKNDKTIKK